MTTARPSDRFGVSVEFLTTEAVVRARGEVDMATVPDFAAVVDSVVDPIVDPIVEAIADPIADPTVEARRGRERERVVVDLADVTFIGADGLGVIAGAAARLRESGRQLSVQSASPAATRLLGLTGLSALAGSAPVRLPAAPSADAEPVAEELVRLQAGVAARAPVDAEPGVAPRALLGTQAGAAVGALADPPELAADLARMTALPANRDVVDAALRLVIALARATVGGADGVSVTLPRVGQLTTVAATDETVAGMDRDQYSTGEGPCVSASTEGQWFHVESLEEEPRWPAFASKARRRGIRSILSAPLLAVDRPLGALNIYSHRAHAFAGRDQELAAVFASEAAGILALAGAGVPADQLGDRLLEALRRRETIAQAQGVLMERDGLGAVEAFGTLLRSSRETARPLHGQAQAVLASTRGRRRDVVTET